MRHARHATLSILLAAAMLSGCGGNQIAADEVTVDPPVLTIPTNADAAPGASAGAADTSADADADATATPTPAADAGTGTSGSGTSGATTGGTGAPAGTGGAAATPAPAATTAPENTGGAQADEGLDQFCADNPGAC